MLLNLPSVLQRIEVAASLDEALNAAVQGIKASLAVDVCSIYLTEPGAGGCALRATDGLDPRAVGDVRFERQEGLVGTVLESGQPLSVEEPEQHPRYRHETPFDERHYRCFLGVPIHRDGSVAGVLSVRQITNRRFSVEEQQALLQLAQLLARHVPAVPPIKPLAAGAGTLPVGALAIGIKGAPGMALGMACLPSLAADFDTVPDRSSNDPIEEEESFWRAVAAVRAELRDSGARLASVVPSEAHAMFRVYAELLDDEHLFSGAIQRIRAGSWAPGALRQTIAEHAQVFEAMEDPYLRARAEDLRGLGRRVLLQLQSATAAPRVYPDHCVLVGDEVSIARIADVPVERLVAIVCRRGSPFSHAALLARSLRIPAVMGVAGMALDELGGRHLLVDGHRGQIVVDPGPMALEAFRASLRQEELRAAELAALREMPARTRDNLSVALQVNVGLISDLPQALACGAQGVGLYRSEFAFMVRDTFPTEDEQVQVYRQVLEAFAPLPVTMRTLDVGSDKPLPYFPIQEANPALGWRGIRLTLDNPGVFLTQLRAMLRANDGLEILQLLLPMVSSVPEVDEACALLDRARDELALEGLQVKRPRIGVMVEVPAALYQLDALAQRVDFFSFGTNDLTQYLIAVDRNNARVSARYDSLHPAVLRAIEAAVRQLQALGRPVSVCGEMAGDPVAALLLVGMGVTSLSMASPCFGDIKLALRQFDSDEARKLCQKALQCDSAAEVRALVVGAMRKCGWREAGAVAPSMTGSL